MVVHERGMHPYLYLFFFSFFFLFFFFFFSSICDSLYLHIRSMLFYFFFLLFLIIRLFAHNATNDTLLGVKQDKEVDSAIKFYPLPSILLSFLLSTFRVYTYIPSRLKDETQIL